MKDLSELLKDSIGEEFYCTFFGKCNLEEITLKQTEMNNTEKQPVLRFSKKDLFPGIVELNRFGQVIFCGTEGECVIFPSKNNRDWDSYIPKLPIDTPVMVSDNGFNWSLRYAANEKGKVYKSGTKSKYSVGMVSYKHIIPVKNFNFENPIANVNYSENETSIMLISYGNSRLITIKIIKDFTGLGLKESKDICDSIPEKITIPKEKLTDCIAALDSNNVRYTVLNNK